MKTKLTFLLTVVLTIGYIPNNLFSQIPTDGLVGFYPFNGNVNDESGNSNHGTVYGVLNVSDRFGNAGKAYSFDGTNNFVSLPNTYDFLPRTINLWFNAADADYSDWRTILASDNPNLEKGLAVIMMKEINGILKMQLSLCDVWDTFDISLNVWHNITLYAGADSSIKYYLDGKLLANDTLSTYITSVNGLNEIILGSSRTSLNRYFKGIIDDVRIYNRELTQSEIESVFYEGGCINHISVTDTLIINMNLVSSNPIIYKNSIMIYPNPTKDHIYIDCGNDYSLLQNNNIRITNSIGEIMFSDKISQQVFKIDLSTWSGKGVYLIYILDSQNNIIDVRKLLLN